MVLFTSSHIIDIKSTMNSKIKFKSVRYRYVGAVTYEAIIIIRAQFTFLSWRCTAFYALNLVGSCAAP